MFWQDEEGLSNGSFCAPVACLFSHLVVELYLDALICIVDSYFGVKVHYSFSSPSATNALESKQIEEASSSDGQSALIEYAPFFFGPQYLVEPTIDK